MQAVPSHIQNALTAVFDLLGIYSGVVSNRWYKR